jgi:hypothetical protein
MSSQLLREYIRAVLGRNLIYQQEIAVSAPKLGMTSTGKPMSHGTQGNTATMTIQTGHEPEEESGEDDLLLEPDYMEGTDDTTDEQSVVSNIAGVTTPLGTGPTYPAGKGKKRAPPWVAVGGAFGGARPAAKKRKKKSV